MLIAGGDATRGEWECIGQGSVSLSLEIIFFHFKVLSYYLFFIYNNLSGFQLHYAEEKRQAAEARARELEKQVLI